jgi:hypothetical protein
VLRRPSQPIDFLPGATLRTNYVLIDYESVQPTTLLGLEQDFFRVHLFVGQQQAKLAFEVAAAMQRLGERGAYVKISGNGPNALDFHIAFYIGVLSSKDPEAYFHVISKDKGFDPLIAHLRELKIPVLRSESISDIPLLKAANSKSLPEKIDYIVSFLIQRGASRPRSVKTLLGTISSQFQKQLGDDEVAAVLAELQKRRLVSINGTKVSYALPGQT